LFQEEHAVIGQEVVVSASDVYGELRIVEDETAMAC
jgi:hypothetical protein